MTYIYLVPTKKDKQPLSVTHPELAKEADGWDPTMFTAGSSRKMSWVCPFEHKWNAEISNRALNLTGCPVCGGRKILIGLNDLLTTHPNIAAEAFGWDPTTTSAGSEEKMKWICNRQHIYESKVSSRKRGSGCPVCSGAKVEKGFNDLATTHPELAKQADGWDPTLISKGSHSVRSWKCNLGHIWSASVTSRRGTGCPICNNKQVLKGFNDLLTTHPDIARQADGWDPTTVSFGSAKKRSWICDAGHKWDAYVNDRRETGCAVCSGRKVLEGLNDLGTTHPDLSKEAEGWNPKIYSSGSGKSVLWKCKLGHTWKATIAGRVAKNNGCPYCWGTSVWVGFNDLQTTHPNIASEAVDWDATKYSAGSGKKVKWKCNEGHFWETRIISRTNGSGCPSCSPMQYDPNEVGYLYFLENPKFEMLQIGITNQPEKRLAKHSRGGWDLIEIQKMDGLLARNWETSILQMLRGRGVVLGPIEIAGKFDGYSEAWSKSTFEVDSIKELMRLTEEFESE